MLKNSIIYKCNRVFFLFFSSFILFQSVVLVVQAKSLEDYWKDVPLKIDDVKGFINQESCLISQEKFIACVQALDKMAIYYSSRSELVTEIKISKKSGEHSMALVLKEISPEENDSGKGSAYELYQDYMKDKDDKLNSFIELYSTKNTVNFDILLSNITSSLSDNYSQSFVFSEAINTYLSFYFDPHTYITPMDFMIDRRNSHDDYAGIGARLIKIGGRLVLYPMEGSPAEKSGVRGGDILVRVDGKDVSDFSIGEVSSLLKGAVGTSVKLIVQRKDRDIDLLIIRDRIVLKNVTYKVVKDSGVAFGYIKLRSFQNKSSCEDIEKAITKLEKKKVEGFILDLRNNGGGLLRQADCIAGLFLSRGSITYQVQNLQDSSDELQATRNYSFKKTKLPMVTLINEGSASASEVVSGALQDHKRSWIVGERSFGKGTVQNLVPIKAMPFPIISGEAKESLLLAFTVQIFYQPSGKTNQIVGIQPEFEVPRKPDATLEERFSLREGDLYSYNVIDSDKQRGEPLRLSEARNLKKNCITNLGVAEELYNKKTAAQEEISDYQLYYAQDVLRCM